MYYLRLIKQEVRELLVSPLFIVHFVAAKYFFFFLAPQGKLNDVFCMCLSM